MRQLHGGVDTDVVGAAETCHITRALTATTLGLINPHTPLPLSRIFTGLER
jgi:hypothetical protein